MDLHGRSFDSAVNSAADRQPELANGKLPCRRLFVAAAAWPWLLRQC